MEWIKDYWYLIILGFAAAMFLFGHRSNKSQDGHVHDPQHGTHSAGETHKSGHGCCH